MPLQSGSGSCVLDDTACNIIKSCDEVDTSQGSDKRQYGATNKNAKVLLVMSFLEKEQKFLVAAGFFWMQGTRIFSKVRAFQLYLPGSNYEQLGPAGAGPIF